MHLLFKNDANNIRKDAMEKLRASKKPIPVKFYRAKTVKKGTTPPGADTFDPASVRKSIHASRPTM